MKKRVIYRRRARTIVAGSPSFTARPDGASPHPLGRPAVAIAMTKEEIIEGLKAGRTLVVDRRDSPALPILFELERKGKVTQEFVQYDEQSSAVKWRWVKKKDRV